MPNDTNSHDTPFPYDLDKEDSEYMQQAAKIIFHPRNFNAVDGVLQTSQSLASDVEKLFSDIVNKGIDEEDMFYLKICFDTMKNQERNCLACKILKWNVPSNTSGETITRPTTLEETITRPTSSEYTYIPITSKYTISEPSLSEYIVSRLTTVEEFTNSRLNTSQCTITRPATSEETISRPTTLEHTITIPTTSEETITRPTTSEYTYIPITSEYTISEPSLSEYIVSRLTTVEEFTNSRLNTSQCTITKPTKPEYTRPATSEETISRPTTSEHTITRPATSEETISRSNTSEDTIPIPITSEYIISQPSLSEYVTSRPISSKYTISRPTKPEYTRPATSEETISRPTTSEHTITRPTTSEETVSRPTTLEDIISRLNNPEEYFARYNHIFNQEACWFHQLNWIPHPTTSEKNHFKRNRNSSKRKRGCARTEGYLKSDKSLPVVKKKKSKEINKAGHSSLNERGFARAESYLKNDQLIAEGKKKKENKNVKSKEISTFKPYSKTYKGKKLTVSKDTWNEQRRRATASQVSGSNLFNFNHLKFLNSKLKLGKSNIHGLGVFASEPIGPHEIIIEYVGEIIRPIIADLREKDYKQSFCFTIDDQTVVDASKFGNISRFINHSCQPNSYAKLLVFNNQKKIVIYAKRDISAGEEITYDYKMKSEDDKIECLCRTRGCKKSLN